MDAFLSRSGIKDAKTNIGKAEVYLLAEPGTKLDPGSVREMIEGEYGYGFRSFASHTDRKWEEFGDARR
jgi:hypothetical protein